MSRKPSELQHIQTRKGVASKSALLQVPDKPEGYKVSREVARIAFTCEVYLDQTAIHYLCNRAALSKTGRAKSGPIIVRATERTTTPV